MKLISLRFLITSFALILFFNFQSKATTKQDVNKEVTEATDTAINYSKEQKDKFQNEMKKKLSDLNEEIENLKNQATSKTGEAKKMMDEQIADLEIKKQGVKTNLEKLKKSSGKAWAQMKSGLNQAWDSLTTSYEKAKNEFKEGTKN